MMEMMETASILKNATIRSLIIMDEIGRGTASDEGFALAWAITSHLLTRLPSRCLFATHYTGLAKLVAESGNGQCLMTRAIVGEDEDDGIVFLHSITPGVAEHSHAIEIARFAGIM